MRVLFLCLLMTSILIVNKAQAHEETVNGAATPPPAPSTANPSPTSPEEFGDAVEGQESPTEVDHPTPTEIRDEAAAKQRLSAHLALIKEGKVDRADKRRCTMTFATVKTYLTENKLMDSRLPGTCAWQAKYALPKAGWVRTEHNLSNAKKNEVCVVGGGHKICDGKSVGSIMVMTDHGFYDGCSENPISSLHQRPFMGCYKKSQNKATAEK